MQRYVPAVLERHLDAAAGLTASRVAAALEAVYHHSAMSGIERVVVYLDEIGMGHADESCSTKVVRLTILP
jgi:hypothetical protein